MENKEYKEYTDGDQQSVTNCYKICEWNIFGVDSSVCT